MHSRKALATVAPAKKLSQNAGQFASQSNNRNSIQINDTKSVATPSSTQFNLQLCYLQISQAWPLTLNYIIYIILRANDSDYNIGIAAVSSGMEFEAASKDLGAAYYLKLIGLLVNLTDMLSHCFHFYMYMAFSKRFRTGFWERFRRNITAGN